MPGSVLSVRPQGLERRPWSLIESRGHFKQPSLVQRLGNLLLGSYAVGKALSVGQVHGKAVCFPIAPRVHLTVDARWTLTHWSQTALNAL